MAKQPHHDDEQTPPSSEAASPPKTPPAAAFTPNMSLEDAPVAKPVTSKEIPLAKPAPGTPPSSVFAEAEIVADDEVFGEEVADALPVEPVNKAESDVFLADDAEEPPAAQRALSPSKADEAESASAEVLAEEGVLEDEAVPVQPMDSPVVKATPPISGAVQETEAVLEAHPHDAEEALAGEDVEALGSSAVLAEPMSGDLVEASSASSVAAQDASAEAAEAAIPLAEEGFTFAEPEEGTPSASEAHETIPLAEEEAIPVAQPAPIAQGPVQQDEAAEVDLGSAVLPDEAAAEAPAGASGASWAELGDVFGTGSVATPPASGVHADDLAFPLGEHRAEDVEEMEVEEAAPASDAAADALFDASDESSEEVAEAVPASAVEEEPASAVLAEEAAEDVAEAEASSAVHAEEDALGESGPASEVSDELPAEASEEMAPGSAIAAFEQAPHSGIDERAPASAVFGEEVASEPESTEQAEASAVSEAAVVEPSEEEVHADEMAETTPASALQAEEGVLSGEEPGPSEQAAVASDIAADALFEASAESAPASAVEELEEIHDEAAPASGLHDDDVVFDDDIAEAAPASAVQAEESVLSEEESEDVEPAGSASDIAAEALLEAHEQEEPAATLEASEEAIEEASPASAVQEAEEAVLDDEVGEATPASGIAADVLFDEPGEEAAPASAAEASDEVLDDDIASAAPVSEVQAEENVIGEDLVEEAAPASEVHEIEEEEIEDLVEAAPESAVFASEEVQDDEITEAAPASAVEAADEVFDEDDSAVAAPASELQAEEVAAEAAPASDLAAEALFEEANAEDEAASEIEAADEVLDDDSAAAAPASEVIAVAEADEEIAEAAPESAVMAAVEEQEDEIAEVAPASEVLADEDAAEIADASSTSAIMEEAEEVSSSTRKAESVLDEEEVMQAEEASSAALATHPESAVAAEDFDEDATEYMEEPPAASKKKKTAPVHESESGAVVFDDLDEGLPAKKPRKAGKSGARKKGDVDQTIAFEGLESASGKSGQPDSTVTGDDFPASSEGSAVQLGDMPARKGSSAVSGIDPVAEALESGVGIGEEEERGKASASVEFDEILDDLGDSAEHEVKSRKAKKLAGKKKVEEESTEMEAGLLAEEAESVEESVLSSKGKKDAKKDKQDATGKKGIAHADDEVDLASMFDEEDAEAAEAVEEAEEDVTFDEDIAAEAEAAEAVEEEIAEAEEEDAVAFDDEVAEADEAEEDEEAAEAFDEEIAAAEEEEAEEALDEDELPTTKAKAKTKPGKKAASVDDEEDLAADELLDDDEIPAQKSKTKTKSALGKKKPSFADEDEDIDLDEDEDTSTRIKGKKDKKGKPIAPPVQPAGGGRLLPMMFGMFFAVILVAGGAAAAWFFAPDTIKDVAKSSLNLTEPTVAKKAVERSNLDLARDEIAQGNYKAAHDRLKNATVPAELGTRGEARWLEYLKDQGDKVDPNAAAVKEARDDLTKADNKVLLAQIDKTLKAKELNDKLTDLLANEGDKAKEFELTKTAKEKAEKLIEESKKALVESKVADKVEDIDVAMMPKLLKDLGVKKTVLEEVNKLLKDAKIEGEGEEGVKAVLKSKKDNEDKIAAVNKVLEDEKIKGEGAEGVKEIAKMRNEVAKDRDDLITTIATAFKELVDGKIVPMDDDPRKQIVAGVKIARQKAESPLSIPLGQLGMSLSDIGTGTGKMVGQTFDMAKVFSELGFFRLREPFIQTPEKKMDTYLALLSDRTQNKAEDLKAIHSEVDWVLSKDSKAGAEARGKALYVKGLALRNQENFDEAKTAIEESLKETQTLEKPGPWIQAAKKVQQELSDPSAYYVPRMERLKADKNLPAALEEANRALKAIPKNAVLLTERGLIRYEMFRGKGTNIPPAVQELIRTDAQEAAAAARDDMKISAKSEYLLGLLEEELGHLKKAENLYRNALNQARKIQPEARADVGLYLDALGNVLLRENTEPMPDNNENNEEAKKKADKVGLVPLPLPRQRTVVVHPWTLMVVSATIALQPADKEEDPKNDPKLLEVKKLADELINSDNPKLKGQGYVLLGQVYAKQGDRTEGLKVMSKGLQLLFPGKATSELNKMIEEHPAFAQPDIANIPNPDMAVRHFGEGLHYYWAKHYQQAEGQFKLAVRYNNQDARYQYFLGLAMLAQKTKEKRDAGIFAIEQGARLEAKQNPPLRDINLSLERIQGPLRQTLNNYRYKVLAPSPDEN